MRHLIVCGVGVFVLLVGSCVGNEAEDNEIKGTKEHVCREKEKCLALIDIAEDLVTKTKGLCSKSDGAPDCVKREKSSTYMDFTKKLLREVKENFPSCKTYECGNRPRDCSEVLANGENRNGVYTIFPSSRFTETKALNVFCDMETDGGGWTLSLVVNSPVKTSQLPQPAHSSDLSHVTFTSDEELSQVLKKCSDGGWIWRAEVIQRRGNFTPQQDFYLLWQDYKVGFGDVRRDFWLGNDNMHALSNQGPLEIRIELGDARGNRRYAVYESFRLEDEENGYKLRISNYSGDAGDCMTQHSGKKFSTKDEGNVGAVTAVKGAWWINDWAFSHLNGLYLPGEDNFRSVHWYEWLQNEGLAFAEMKVRLR